MNSNTKKSTKKKSIERLVWLLIFVLIIGSVIAYHGLLLKVATAWRVLGMLAVAIICISLASITSQGKKCATLLKEARVELRKVVWPTRQETLQTTLVVIAVTTAMSLLLWGLDNLIVRFISFATGVR